MYQIHQNVRGAIVLALVAGAATLSAQNLNPNGFPSGAHYNLNIIGKKADYNCAPAQPDPLTGLYGNVVFIPETGLLPTDGQIVIKSGRKTAKNTTLYPDLQVTDTCSPGFDGTPAVVELPPSDTGYWVYARALAKPGGSNTLSYSGALFSAIDEYGNDLVYLGLVTSSGVALPSQDLVRTKGRSVAVDITGMFLWSGTVCDIAFDPNGPMVPITSDPQDPVNFKPVCWIDNPAAPDGKISTDDAFQPATVDANGNLSCSTGLLVWVPVTCVEYTKEWIFNIADLVSSDWLVDNDGTKLIQLRFYPAQ